MKNCLSITKALADENRLRMLFEEGAGDGSYEVMQTVA